MIAVPRDMAVVDASLEKPQPRVIVIVFIESQHTAHIVLMDMIPVCVWVRFPFAYDGIVGGFGWKDHIQLCGGNICMNKWSPTVSFSALERLVPGRTGEQEIVHIPPFGYVPT